MILQALKAHPSPVIPFSVSFLTVPPEQFRLGFPEPQSFKMLEVAHPRVESTQVSADQGALSSRLTDDSHHTNVIPPEDQGCQAN